MSPVLRRGVFLGAGAALLAFFGWGLAGLPAFGHYRGPYGDLIDAIAVRQTHATGVVSAVNFFYRGFDTVGEEFILFLAATGVATVLRKLREEREEPTLDHDRAPASEAVRVVSLAFSGPVLVLGWFLTTHAQTSPSGGFQGGVIMASGFVLVYLAGQYVEFRRLSPVDITDAVEAVGAGGFVGVGLGAVFVGAPYLADVLPLGSPAGAVDASGTIVLISFFVGVEVAAAFVLIVNELLEQTMVRGGRRT